MREKEKECVYLIVWISDTEEENDVFSFSFSFQKEEGGGRRELMQ